MLHSNEDDHGLGLPRRCGWDTVGYQVVCKWSCWGGRAVLISS